MNSTLTNDKEELDLSVLAAEKLVERNFDIVNLTIVRLRKETVVFLIRPLFYGINLEILINLEKNV